MSDDTRFKVEQPMRNSPLWQALQAHYTKRLVMLRARNDGALSPEDTARLRGQISEVKALLQLAHDAPDMPKGSMP